MVYGAGMAHTVGEIARRAGITIRTLHHYDEIGLLSPSERSDAGYRLYDSADVARLQQILVYRELGLPLERIQEVMGDPGFDRIAALRDQRQELVTRSRQTTRMIEAVDAAIASEERGIMMSTDQMLEVFGDFDPTEHEAEAEERWGGTDAYRDSVRRTSQYTKQDWEQISAEASEIYEEFVRLRREGVPTDSAAAIEVAERHREHISRWFYECSYEIHVGLGEMYVEDQRFTESLDSHGEGLAAYMSEAILANGLRHLD